MQILKPLLGVAAACSLTTATPINVNATPSPSLKERQVDDTPRCGYVRMNEGDGWMVGIYTRGACEVIWQEQAASIFRIDGLSCACKFYTSRESCQNADLVQPYTGPNALESNFGYAKPKWVKCEHT